LSAPNRIELDQQPRRVAYRRDDLAAVEEGAYELQRLLIDAQQVRIDLTTRQHDRVILLDVDFLERLVDGDAFAPVLVLPTANLTLFGRCDDDLCARFAQLAHRYHELGLLESMCGENDDLGFADLWHDSLLRR